VAKCSKGGIFQEDKWGELSYDGFKVINFRYLCGVEEEEEHIDEDFKSFSLLFILPVLSICGDALIDVTIDHLDKLSFVLLIKLQGHLLKTVDDETQSIFFDFVINQQVDFFNEKFSSWDFEMSVKIVGQSLSVVGDHFDFKFRHGSFHNFVNDSIHYFVGVSLQKIL
jgi:hypothetical protein